MAAFTITLDIEDSEEAHASFNELIASFVTEQDISVLPGIRATNLAVGDYLPSVSDTKEKPTHGTADQHSDS